MTEWYAVDNIDEIDTPALLIYPDRVNQNIRILKSFLPETHRLRPHVKTHKSGEISRLLIAAGITKFKCATISGSRDVGPGRSRRCPAGLPTCRT